ncbi:response regulator [Marinicellulosiphila megalodicopiae]|uniref:response regulator n=1 Tax=Marinicellulosiphila megalodicopiae TaxID=2724896 RepID=UPI003BAEFE21
MKQHIMLVEDEVEIAELTKEYLEDNGYKVSVCYNGFDAIQQYQELEPDLIVLDVMLPKMDGMEVCKHIRPTFKGPIMMLTSRDDQIDQILGLELGADDYVPKTSDPRLVLARVKALLRRNDHIKPNDSADDGVLDFGSVFIDFGMREVKVFGNTIELSSPEYELLCLLANSAGKVMTREKIFENMRGIQYDGQNRLVDITVSQLRVKLDSPERIKTVRNKGYQFTNKVD